jgi:beta-N-acetylhexosaminidase
LTDERIEFSVKKILKYKYKAGLNNYKPIETSTLYKDLNVPISKALEYKLYENAITILKNKNDILPLKNLTKSKIAYVKIGDDSGKTFLKTLKNYTEISFVSDDNLDNLLEKLKKFNTVIIGFHKEDKARLKHEFTDKEILWIQKISEKNNVILDVFARPYSLLKFKDFANIKALVLSYQNGDISQEVSAEVIFGAVESKGRIPVSINKNFQQGDGINTIKLNRLGFTAPENVDMNSEILQKIEKIANKAISGKMTPGAQILVARHGKVIYQKSFGYHSYNDTIKVKNSDIYDLASVSKIISTLPNVMQQYDDKKINLETTLGSMVPLAVGSDKDSIKLKDFLTHYARLQAWIPFYKSTVDSLRYPMPKYYSTISTPEFSVPVAENLFMRNDYKDTILDQIIKSKLMDKKEYRYSDFTFILLKEYLERVNKKTLDEISQENFFAKLGMNSTMYNPLRFRDKNDIPPTENDYYFRRQTLQGHVHDMAAAMQGGVAGHAGLFSNSIDVAKMMQMYLQKGKYGGQEFFSEKTFDDFNTCYFCAFGNRRGLGFDKPQPNNGAPTCNCVSKSSFGHTGFTGNMTWADPESDIVYVFLSNRTYPDATINHLAKGNIREDIQQIIQDAIIR